MRRRAAGLIALAWAAVATAGPQTVEIVTQYPHDPQAFTQGLLFHAGHLYESTGRRGQSTLRRVDPDTGEVRAQTRLDARYFGEGLARVGQRLYQLTWTSGTGFIYDLDTLEQLGRFAYDGEGWGLTYDGVHLIMSDGSSRLRKFDPDGFVPAGTLQVRYRGEPVNQLNELEFIDGAIWANVWRTDLIVRIDPATGRIGDVIDAGALRAALTGPYKVDVLNGIAWDAQRKRLLLTGKLWPTLFQVRVPGVLDGAEVLDGE